MKKTLFICLSLQLLLTAVHAQGTSVKGINKGINYPTSTGAINASNILSYRVAQDKTTHIVSPEAILYVDISSPDIEGDMPTKNLVRFKPNASCQTGKQFQVTVVTEQYVMAYKMTLTKNDPDEATVITINPNEAIQTNSYGSVGKAEFDRLAILALSKKRTIKNVKNKENGIEMHLNNIYVIGDFLLYDIGVENKTKLQYDVDQIRFKLTDKKRIAAHSSQEIELTPVYQFYPNEGTTITSKWRNFYLFRKFTYPEEKVFNIELAEKQLSGRQISLNVDYKKVLNSQYLQ